MEVYGKTITGLGPERNMKIPESGSVREKNVLQFSLHLNGTGRAAIGP